MRGRAAEVAERWLGLRSEQEIQESLHREIEQERWTRIDRAIQAKLIDGVIDLRRRRGVTIPRSNGTNVGRLQHLQGMGLAEESSTSVWRVNAQAEPILRAMGERGDIIRTLQRGFSTERRDFDIVGPTGPKTPIVGRIAAKGLADELNDRRYLIVDGIDGRAHYLVLPAGPTSWNYGSAQLLKYVPTIECGRPIKPSRCSRTMASIALPGTCKWHTPTRPRAEPQRPSLRHTSGAWRRCGAPASSSASRRACGGYRPTCHNAGLTMTSGARAAMILKFSRHSPSNSRSVRSALRGSISR